MPGIVSMRQNLWRTLAAVVLIALLSIPALSCAQRGTGGLTVATFNLTPPEPLGDNVEQARQVADSTLTVIRTLLYSQMGEAAAASVGRRMWFDRNTLQLTVTDTPENIRTITDYIKSVAAPA